MIPSAIIGASSRNSAQIAVTSSHLAHLSGSFLIITPLPSASHGEPGHFYPLDQQIHVSFPAPLVAVDLLEAGRLAVVADAAGRISIFDYKTEEVVSAFETAIFGFKVVNFVRFVGSSLLLVVAVDTVVCFDWRTRRRLASTSLGGRRVLAISRVKEDAVFVTGGGGFARVLGLRKVRGGSFEVKVLQQFTSENLVCCGVSGRDVIVAGSNRGMLYFISSQNYTVLKALNVGSSISSLDVGKDLLVVGVSGGITKILDLRTRVEKYKFSAHSEAETADVVSVRIIDSEHPAFLSLYSDSSLILWRPNASHFYVLGKPGRLVSGCSLSHDQFAVLSEQFLSIWSSNMRALLRSVPLSDLREVAVVPRDVFGLKSGSLVIWWSDETLTLLSEDGRVLEVYKTLKQLSAVHASGDFVALSEISGRVVLLDRNFHVVSEWQDSTGFVATSMLLMPKESFTFEEPHGHHLMLSDGKTGRLKTLELGGGSGRGFVEAESGEVAVAGWCVGSSGDYILATDLEDGVFSISVPKLELDFIMKVGTGGGGEERVELIEVVSESICVCVSGRKKILIVDLSKKSVIEQGNLTSEILRILVIHSDLVVLLTSGEFLIYNLQSYVVLSPLPHARFTPPLTDLTNLPSARLSVAKLPRWSSTPDDAEIILSPRKPRGQWHRESKVGGEIREIPSLRLSHAATEAGGVLGLIAEAERAIEGIRRLHPGFSLEHCSGEEAQALEDLRIKTSEFSEWLRSHLYHKHPKLNQRE